MKGKKKTEKKKRTKKTSALPGNPVRDGAGAHPQNNPQIDEAIADFINAEASFGRDDPAEGQAEQIAGRPKKESKPRYWDRCISSPGEFDTVHCGLCDTQCEVKRNLYGPTCYAMAVGGSKAYHDLFTCPYREERWHRRASKLALEIERTASKRLKSLLAADLQDCLREKETHHGDESQTAK